MPRLVLFRARGEALLVVLATGLYAAGLCLVPPTVFASGDYVLEWKPTFHFLAASVRAGTLPLWNPYVGLGRPFLADTQNLVFYPPAYLICAGQQLGVFLLIWLHGLLAVAGMRRLGGVFGAGRWQSYAMGFMFLGSGALTARYMTGQLHYCWGLCYVPWLFYFAVRTEEAWQARRLAAYAGCLAAQFLCGHPQVFWLSAVGQGMFILARASRLPLRPGLRDAGRGLGQFGVACAGCAGLVAVVLLPMLELIGESNRSANSPAFANSYNLAWTDFGFWFSPIQAAGARWEANFFIGALVVVLGVAGLCRVRERNVRGLLGMLVLALLLGLGDKTPAFGLFYRWLPGFAGFRFHSRDALLAEVALICAAGIWCSRAHPRLRAAWDYLFAVPVRYAVIALVLLQSLDLLRGLWMTKRVVTYSCLLAAATPLEDSFEHTLVAELRKADLIKPSLSTLRSAATEDGPPPRVCVPPSLVPADYGMIHGYAHFDANCSLFLRRPWDYLHAALGITPPVEKGSLSEQVYDHAPFPYRNVSLALGVDAQTGRIAAAAEPDPRAFVVYRAEAGDYGAVLDRLVHGHDIRQSALLEKPLAEPLPQGSGLPGAAASVRQFGPNSLLVDVEARTNALLVVGEAWYPGWQAEIDGQAGQCLPANIWMRAVPVPAGRHQIRLFFRQHYLLAGSLISLASMGLLLVAMAKPSHPIQAPVQAQDAPELPKGNGMLARRGAGSSSAKRRKSGPSPPRASAYRPLLRVLAAGALLGVGWLVVRAGIHQVWLFQVLSTEAEGMAQCQIADVLALQNHRAQALAHYTEAVRLGERACELTGYAEPLPLQTLAFAYAKTGHLDMALATANRGRDCALAGGHNEQAEALLGLIKQIERSSPAAVKR